MFEENITRHEGVIERPELLMSYPHFEVIDCILYWIDKGKVAGKRFAQILVPC